MRQGRRWCAMRCVWLGLAGLCGWLVSTGVAATPSPGVPVGPEERLRRVTREIEVAKGELAAANKKFFTVKQDLLFSIEGGELVDLQREINAMEKRLADKRKALAEKLAASPQWQAVAAERKQLYDRMNQLKERERLIANELKAKNWKSEAKKRPLNDKR